MKPYVPDIKHKFTIFIYGVLIISAFLLALLAVKNIIISPDAMIYSLISEEIRSGHGIRLPIIMNLEDSHVFVDGSIPYHEEPPFLAILFAILGGVKPHNYLAAQLINTFSFVLIAIFTFLLMKKLYSHNGIALITGLLVSTSFPLLRAVHHIWSESIFIALTIMVIYFLTLSRHSNRLRLSRNLLVASIFASLAILTRYVGIAMIPALWWALILLVKNKSLKLKSVLTIFTAILPVITTGILLLNAYIVSGSIFGRHPPSPGRSYLRAFTGTIEMILLQFNLGERYIPLITVFAVVLVLFLLSNTTARRELSKHLHSGLDLIIVFIISYTALISYAMATSQTVFELRFMYPLVPFLFILYILIIIIIGEIIRLKGFSKLSLCVIILSLGLLTFGNCYKTYLRSGEFSYKQEKQYSILNSSTYKWIKGKYGENVIITSNRPFHLSFFGGYSTIRLPHMRFNKNFRIPDNMESFLPNRMSYFRSDVLALFETVDEQYEGSYLAGLFNNRKDADNFVLIRTFSDGVVYTLKK